MTVFAQKMDRWSIRFFDFRKKHPGEKPFFPLCLETGQKLKQPVGDVILLQTGCAQPQNMKGEYITVNSKKWNLGIAYSIGAIWFGSHVGGGFASGNQAWNFMGRFGAAGIAISLFAMVLVGVAGREILLSAKLHKSGNYREWAKEAYTPIQTFGAIFFELQVWCLYILASSGAVAGCAALLESYGVPYLAGVVLTGGSLVLISIFGGEVYRKASAYMTAVLLVCLAIVYLVILIPGIPQYAANAAELKSASTASAWDLIWSGCKYAGFQIFGFINMTSLAKNWKKSEITAGTLIGFVLNAGMLALSIVCLICWAPIAGNTTIPILTTLQTLEKTWVTVIYSVALFLAFVSTAAGAVFATVARVYPFTAKMKGSETGKSAVIAVAFIVITMLVSLAGLDAIVKIGYSWVGVFAVFSIIGWAIVVLLPRNLKAGREGLLEETEAE